MSEDAGLPLDTPDTAAAPAADEPAWKNDEYLTSGRRFMRWNLVSLVLGLAALVAGALWLRLQG